jgi:CDP-paratose 2-epimerase
VWVDRCGVLAGAGQFGTAEQGIISYWLHAYAQRRPLRYIGFDRRGHQVRDAFHPDDLAALVFAQMTRGAAGGERVFNVGGGIENAMSLAQLSAWCAQRFGEHVVASDQTPRPFDVPWFVMNSARTAETFGWRPARGLATILDEIAAHAEQHPGWLELTAGS